MNIPSFLNELKRRKVYGTAVGYAVVGWVLLQIGEVTFEPLHFPAWVMTTLVIVVLLGFPVSMVIAWFFVSGLTGFTRDTGSAPAVAQGTSSQAAGESPSIAVLPFVDMSPD